MGGEGVLRVMAEDGSNVAVAEYWDIDSVHELLERTGLVKHKQCFEGVSFAEALTFDGGSLKRIGVPTFGARRLLEVAIKELRALRSCETGPGWFLTLLYFEHDRASKLALTAKPDDLGEHLYLPGAHSTMTASFDFSRTVMVRDFTAALQSSELMLSWILRHLGSIYDARGCVARLWKSAGFDYGLLERESRATWYPFTFDDALKLVSANYGRMMSNKSPPARSDLREPAIRFFVVSISCLIRCGATIERDSEEWKSELRDVSSRLYFDGVCLRPFSSKQSMFLPELSELFWLFTWKSNGRGEFSVQGCTPCIRRLFRVCLGNGVFRFGLARLLMKMSRFVGQTIARVDSIVDGCTMSMEQRPVHFDNRVPLTALVAKAVSYICFLAAKSTGYTLVDVYRKVGLDNVSFVDECSGTFDDWFDRQLLGAAFREVPPPVLVTDFREIFDCSCSGDCVVVTSQDVSVQRMLCDRDFFSVLTSPYVFHLWMHNFEDELTTIKNNHDFTFMTRPLAPTQQQQQPQHKITPSTRLAMLFALVYDFFSAEQLKSVHFIVQQPLGLAVGRIDGGFLDYQFDAHTGLLTFGGVFRARSIRYSVQIPAIVFAFKEMANWHQLKIISADADTGVAIVSEHDTILRNDFSTGLRVLTCSCIDAPHLHFEAKVLDTRVFAQMVDVELEIGDQHVNLFLKNVALLLDWKRVAIILLRHGINLRALRRQTCADLLKLPGISESTATQIVSVSVSNHAFTSSTRV